VLFSCRWPTARPVPVWIREGTDAAQRRLVERALRAFERAGLGIAFELAAGEGGAQAWHARRGITVEWIARAEAAGDPGGTGDAVADCRLDPARGRQARAPGAPLAAELVSASVRVRLEQPDALGRPVALDEEERFAALVHELGHALGFASHTAIGSDPLRKSVGEVRLAARRVLRGAAPDWPTLRALYLVPSGTVLGRARLAEGRARDVAVLGRAAAAHGLDGPFARAGERSAELFWRGDGTRYVLAALRGEWPAHFHLVPNTAARRVLRGADAAPPPAAPSR